MPWLGKAYDSGPSARFHTGTIPSVQLIKSNTYPCTRARKKQNSTKTKYSTNRSCTNLLFRPRAQEIHDAVGVRVAHGRVLIRSAPSWNSRVEVAVMQGLRGMAQNSFSSKYRGGGGEGRLMSFEHFSFFLNKIMGVPAVLP